MLASSSSGNCAFIGTERTRILIDAGLSRKETFLRLQSIGETPDNIRNHPALKGLTIPRTGRQGRIGVLVTKTLVVAGEGGFFTAPNGQRGAMLRAYDKASGREVGSVYMPAPQTGSPMTYFYNGKQYVVLAVSGASFSGELIAFRLP